METQSHNTSGNRSASGCSRHIDIYVAFGSNLLYNSDLTFMDIRGAFWRPALLQPPNGQSLSRLQSISSRMCRGDTIQRVNHSGSGSRLGFVRPPGYLIPPLRRSEANALAAYQIALVAPNSDPA
ncbi:hypothetical protein Bbelb_093410 [Branchiostoma belcheri]|nr:hypothetical protein Bbelb_093410 [Branchiostoma belcheri]